VATPLYPVLLCALLGALPVALPADPKRGDEPPPGPPWFRSHREACRDALLHGRPVFVYFTKTH
jgi:hypothetical protein